MGVVSFERIKKILPSQAIGMDTPNATPFNVTTGHPERPTLYDPIWGYFTFGQSIGFDYSDAETYLDVAVFTIQGVFTATAEAGNADNLPSQGVSFAALTAKYEALKAHLNAAQLASPPGEFKDFGTAQDQRLIPLPLPLVDKNNARVYVFPQSLDLAQTRFPVEIRYTATLREAKFPQGKVMLNGVMIDNGIISINAPKPIMNQHRLAGTSGAILQIHNYTPIAVEVNGTLPNPGHDGQLMTPQIDALYDSIALGGLNVVVTKRDGTQVSLFTNISVDEDPRIDAQIRERTATISVRGRV